VKKSVEEGEGEPPVDSEELLAAEEDDDLEVPIEEPCSNVWRIPGDVKRFGAYIRVHRYLLCEGNAPLQDVVQAITEHTEDQEICLVGLQGLMQGVDNVVMIRLKELVGDATFISKIREIIMQEPEAEVANLVMKLSTRMMLFPLGSDTEDVEETCAVAIATVLDSADGFYATGWESLLEAIDSLVGARGTESGRRMVARLEILRRLDEEWEKLLAKKDNISKMLVKTFKEDTERILKR